MLVVNPDQQVADRVSHNPAIRKFKILDNGEIPHLTGLSRAIIPPGETASAHVHPDMAEVFLVQSGRATIKISGETVRLVEGVCIVVEPGEVHEITCSDDTSLELLYFGVMV